MIAFEFTFPGGRYHATPWNRHVNEADVAWPPEPVRVLRALIATWWRKGDHDVFSKAMLDGLIDTLASEPPVFQLPEAVHTHIRAFMPIRKNEKRLILDGFLKIRPHDPLVVAWPDTTLEPDQEALASHLLERLGYLGRAESWVQAGLAPNWLGEFNAAPRIPGETPSRGSAAVNVMATRTPSGWRDERARQIEAASAMKGAEARRVLSALPERLCEAIAVDTSEWQAAGWSIPPALRYLTYDRPEIGPLPTTRTPTRLTRDPLKAPGHPEVARFLLAGRPRPRVEDSLRIGEVLRHALMSRCPEGVVPPELSGRDTHGPLRDDPLHAHAFYLSEDADGDGEIDHLVVYSRIGFSDTARQALDRLTLLYIDKSRARLTMAGVDADAEANGGRKEWRVALDQLGPHDDIRGSRLLDRAQIWASATPFLKSRHDHVTTFDFEAQVESYAIAFLREWQLRRPGEPAPKIEAIRQKGQGKFGIGPRERSPLHFARTRSRGRGGSQPDTMGASLKLIFDVDVKGPLVFGKHAHFGMGLFTHALVPI